MKVVTFGEIMMRLNPEGYYRLCQADRLEVSYAGGEANVAAELSCLGIDASFVTKLPKNDLGACARNELRKYGVLTDKIVYGGKRLGVYFVEKGASQRPSKVIYDRADSSIADAKPDDFDWKTIFQGADWFHWTGITPALGGALPQICLEACKTAHEMGLTISCDLNYRKKLWTREKASDVMATLMPYVDVCMANEADAADVFGIHAENSNVNSGLIDKNGYISVAQQLALRFGFKAVSITLRESISANDNNWAAMLYTDGRAYFSRKYGIHIVDRIGGGDSFAGALIYALLQKQAAQDAIDFAVAASCLDHSIEHDFNLVTLEEVNALKNGSASGRIQR